MNEFVVSRTSQPSVDTMHPALVICGNGTEPSLRIDVADVDCAHALVDAAVWVLIAAHDKARHDALIDAQARDRGLDPAVSNISDMPMSPGWYCGTAGCRTIGAHEHRRRGL